MNFINELGQSLDWSQFSESFPNQATILKGSQELYPKITLHLGDEWGLSHAELNLSPFKLEINQKRNYHTQFFKSHSYFQENLIKALGIKKDKRDINIIDLSAGTLSDSLLINTLGAKVSAYERNPLLACLISHELQQRPWANFTFHFGQWQDEVADIFYFDPMYDEPNEKSAPKKSMQLLRKIVEVDQDAKEFAQSILDKKHKLVIKRPRRADVLISGVHHEILGKSTRYDVYHP